MADVIQFPGTAFWGIRPLVEAWERAGRPRFHSAGRLYGEQKYLWDGYAAGKPGFFPADNPDDESQRLAHVRFAALDITNITREIRSRLEAAGLIFPYDYEPWHCELPNVRRYPIVRSLPTITAGSSKPIPIPEGDEDMSLFIIIIGAAWYLCIPKAGGGYHAVAQPGDADKHKSEGNDRIPRKDFTAAYNNRASKTDYRELTLVISGLPS